MPDLILLGYNFRNISITDTWSIIEFDSVNIRLRIHVGKANQFILEKKNYARNYFNTTKRNYLPYGIT